MARSLTKIVNWLSGDDTVEVIPEVVEKNGNKKEEQKDVPFRQINGKTTTKGVTLVTIGDGPTLALTLKKTNMAIGFEEFKYLKEMVGDLDEKTDLIWAEAQKIKVNDKEFMSLKENGKKYEYADKEANFNIGKPISPAKPKKPSKSSTT